MSQAQYEPPINPPLISIHCAPTKHGWLVVIHLVTLNDTMQFPTFYLLPLTIFLCTRAREEKPVSKVYMV